MLRTRPRPATPPAAPRERFRRTRRVYRSKGFGVFSVLFVVALALAGVWVVVWGNDPADAPAAQAPVTAPSSAPAPTPAPAEGGCPALPFEDQSLPATAPAADWQPVASSAGAAAAPSSRAVGPVADDAGVARCYARTPTGALFAAANFLAALSDPTTLEDGLLDLAEDGEGQQRLWLLYGFDPAAVVGGGGGYEVAGYSFLSVGMETAVVSVVLRADGGGLTAVPLTLVWNEGTWLVRLPADGNLVARAQPLSTLAGYTAWQAR